MKILDVEFTVIPESESDLYLKELIANAKFNRGLQIQLGHADITDVDQTGDALVLCLEESLAGNTYKIHYISNIVSR